MREHKYVIIGGGCSGMAAALQLWKLGEEDILLIDRGERLGGVLNQCLHQGFGDEYFERDMTGREFALELSEKLGGTGVKVMTDTTAAGLSPDGKVSFTNSDGYFTVSAGAVILATGCRERPIDGTQVFGTRPAGIFTAGQAQRMVNIGGYDIGENFVILGSGDVGMIVARDLVLRGKNVIALLERKALCGGLERNRRDCIEEFGIPVKTQCTAYRILGSNRIEGVEARHLDTGEREIIPCDTLIVSIGLIPERELSEEACAGGAWPEWLFLSGNCDFVHDTADTAAIDGEEAAKDACKYVRTGERPALREKPRGVRGKLGPGEKLCLNCPRGCALYICDGAVSGNACGNYDKSILEVIK